MDYSKFLKDILSVPASFGKNPSFAAKFQEVSDGLLNGLVESLPEELKGSTKKFMKDKTPQERIDFLMNVDGFDFPEFLEAHLKNVFESGDPFQYKGMTVSPKDLQKTYEESKAKFQKYENSEDINNF